MMLWGKKPLKNYGPRMTESILSILRHILQGEKIIKERTEKEEAVEAASNAAGAAATGGAAATTARPGGTGAPAERREEPEADVNPEHLRQLMDMGFSRAHCIEALLHTMTVEQATDYLLTNPATLRRSVCICRFSGADSFYLDIFMKELNQIECSNHELSYCLNNPTFLNNH